MSNLPPVFPLKGLDGFFDLRLSNPTGKLSDSWLDNEYLKLTLISPESTKENNRKRRNGHSSQSEEESCDDMAISDCEPGAPNGSSLLELQGPRENGHVHPPKRRLTTVLLPATVTDTPDTSGSVSVVRSDPVHPHTPNNMDSPTNTPISDIEEPSQQLPLPSPSASPVQSGTLKPSFSPLEHELLNVPSTQGELLDLMLNLLNYLTESNKNYLVFQLLQNINRTTLSSFNNLIYSSLKRDILSNVPLEIAYNILSHLDYKSVLAVSGVCKNWNKILNKSYIWKNLLKKDKLIESDMEIEQQLSNPKKLFEEWAFNPLIHLENLSMAQLLYKKRLTILRRWMNPSYKPKRVSVPGQGSNVVTCLQHDDEKIITGIDDKLINIYNTLTGELLKILKGHEGGVWALKYTGNTLVSGSTDRTVRVWNIETGRCTHVFRGHTSTVRCLDILHPVVIGKNDKGEDIIFPEVPLLVTGSRDHNLHVWKLPLDNEQDHMNAKEQQVFDSNDIGNPYLVAVLAGHTQSVRSVTGYGNIIISGSYDTTVRVWDLTNGGRCKFILEGHNDRIYSTALNFHAKKCYSGSMDSSINVWDIENGELLYSLEGHSSLVGLLELSEDYLVSAAADSTLRVWDPHSSENYSKLKGHSGAITCFQHDNLRVVSGSVSMLKLWNIQTGQFVRDLLADITGGIWQVRFDFNRCIAAVQRTRNESEETFIEVLDFSVPPSREYDQSGDVIQMLPLDEARD